MTGRVEDGEAMPGRLAFNLIGGEEVEAERRHRERSEMAGPMLLERCRRYGRRCGDGRRGRAGGTLARCGRRDRHREPAFGIGRRSSTREEEVDILLEPGVCEIVLAAMTGADGGGREQPHDQECEAAHPEGRTKRS
jgi:hypothetical protein